jgi:hypothetical protein
LLPRLEAGQEVMIHWQGEVYVHGCTARQCSCLATAHMIRITTRQLTCLLPVAVARPPAAQSRHNYCKLAKNMR